MRRRRCGPAAAARRAGAGVAACLALTAAVPATAQQWTAEARLGRLEFRLAPTDVPAATSLALGLGFARTDRRFHLTAGVPLGQEDPLWGALNVLERSTVEAGAVTLGLQVGGQGFLQRYTRSFEPPSGPLTPPTLAEQVSYGWGVAATALPFAAVRMGPASLEGRAGASFYRNGVGDLSASRTVGLGEVHLTAAASPALALTAETRHYRAEEGNWTFVGAGALATIQGTELWGTLGRWLEDDVQDVPWSVGAATRLAERLDLMVEARQDALDPLYGSAPRRSWTAALRVRLNAPPTPAEPVPASYDGRTATIVLPARDAGSSPRIAADFNDWTPQSMTRSGERWVWTGHLEPGVYQYAFVAPDGEWFVPASVAGRTDDGMGGHVALLVVEEPTS